VCIEIYAGESKMMDALKAIFVMSLFYSLATTLLVHSLPETTIASHYIKFTDIQTQAEQFRQTVELERNIPIVNLGVMVFYSGNLFVDLLVNFVTAIPSMFSLILELLLLVFSPSTEVQSTIQLFFYLTTTTLYLISVLSSILSIRTGRVLE